jgi:hypothetical protein
MWTIQYLVLAISSCYNLMVLFVLPMTMKISVQVGYMATFWMTLFWNVDNGIPALPLLVVTHSI